MNTLISAQDAFNALRAGKTILCRHILGEFDSLDQFPATVFALPEHEFCIQLEMMELAGIEFTKPLALDEVMPDQDIFVVQPHGVIHQYKFDGSDMLADCIISGFAQRDAKNAELQFKAFCKFFSHDYFSIEHTDIRVIEISKKRSRKSKTVQSDSVTQLDSANDDVSIDDILGPVSVQSLTSNDVEKKTLADESDEIPPVADPEETRVTPARQWTRFHNDKPCPEADGENQYETELTDLIAIVNNAKTINEVNSVISKTSHWTEEQRLPLVTAISKRLVELDVSLLDRIKSAPSMATLKIFLADVTTLPDAVYAHECMMAYEKRKQQLTQI